MFDVLSTFFVLDFKTKDQKDSGSSLFVKASWLYGVGYIVWSIFYIIMSMHVCTVHKFCTVLFSFWSVSRVKSVQPKRQPFLH